MSKFFDQTLKARGGLLREASFTLEPSADPAEPESAPDVSEPSVSDVRLEHCQKMVVQIDKLMQDQFKGSKGLQAAEESYRALRTRLLRLRAERQLRSVVITSAAQGEGKTHTSANLAMFCSQLRHLKVLLIDADIRSCGLSRALHLPPTPGLAEVLAGKCEAGQAIIATQDTNLYMLGAGTCEVAPPELFAGQRWAELMKWCNDTFELVLVDSTPILNLADVELISAACDGILMVVRALHTKRELLKKSAAQIDSKKLVGLVYNATESSAFHRYPYRTYGTNPKN